MPAGKNTMSPAEEARWLEEMKTRAAGTYLPYSPRPARQKVAPIPMTERKRQLVDLELAHLRAIRQGRC